MSLATTVSLASFGRADKAEDAAAVAKLLKSDKGVGTKYGSRNPWTCPSSKVPEKGPPTAAQARAYFIAMNEHEKLDGGIEQILVLMEDVTIEVGKGRPFAPGDGTKDDFDPTELVYPVRGGYTTVTCHALNTVYLTGKNCTKFEQPHAEGLCYRNAFGDWKVLMLDVATSKTVPGWFPAPRRPPRIPADSRKSDKNLLWEVS